MLFSNFRVTVDNSAAYDFAARFADVVGGTGGVSFSSGRSGIVFFGPTGTGKTHLACAVLNRAIRAGVFGRFLPTYAIPKHDSDEIERLCDPDEYPLLLLDDLGVEKLTDRALECLDALIDGRLWHGAATLITTNFSQDGLRSRFESACRGFGDRIVGRMNALCEFVPVGGADHRWGA